VKLPPPFDERSFGLQVAGGIVVPMVFGLITGFALGWNEIVYYILAVPIAIAGGFLGGIEHLNGRWRASTFMTLSYVAEEYRAFGRLYGRERW
jgi:hypothetical protein